MLILGDKNGEVFLFFRQYILDFLSATVSNEQK